MNFSNQNLSTSRKSNALLVNYKNTFRKKAKYPYAPLYEANITDRFARCRYLLPAILRNLKYIAKGQSSISTITYIYPPPRFYMKNSTRISTEVKVHHKT